MKPAGLLAVMLAALGGTVVLPTQFACDGLRDDGAYVKCVQPK